MLKPILLLIFVMTQEDKYIQLDQISSFETSKVYVNTIKLKQYISTENMISNLGGIVLATNKPENGKITQFLEGDILISNIRPYLKKIWFANENGGCSSDILVLRPNNKINSKYLYYLLSSDKFFNYMMATSKGTKMPRGDKNAIKKFKIPLVSITEQNKWVNLLSQIDKKLILMQKKHKNVEKIKEYFIQTKINEINSNSEFIKVKDAFSITRGEVIAKTKVKETPDEVYKYPVYSSQTLNDGIMGYYSDYDFSGDFITWTTDGANAGKTKFRSGEFKCSNVCGVLKAKKEYEYYSNEFIATYLDKNTYKYVSYVGNPKLMNNVMSTIKIPIVDKETTDYYSNVISQFDLKYRLEEIKLNKLKEFKKGLLQKMFV